MVQRRLYGYSRLRAKFVVTLEFHPTQFHFGALIYSWHPNNNTSAVSFGATRAASVNAPHVFLDCANPSIVEFELPWFYPHQTIDIISSTQLNTYDNILMMFEYAALGYANGSTIPSIQVTMKVHMRDVELTVPSLVGPFTQSGRLGEFNLDRPSRLAQVVAVGARAMSNLVPSIAPFARASEMLAAGLQALGFSTPHYARARDRMVPVLWGARSQVDLPSSAEKLSLYSTQEMSVGAGPVGNGNSDPMDLKVFTGVESFLCSFTWAQSAVSTNILYCIPVGPAFCTELAGSPNVWYPTAVGYASMAFEYWRGSLIYRFKVFCSRAHRGRLRFVYEPSNSSLSTDPYGFSNHCVLDLDADKELELEIGFNSSQGWLLTNTGASTACTTLTGSIIPGATTMANGNLWVIVESQLISSSTTNADVVVGVHVSAGPDFELAVPTLAQIGYWTSHADQSGHCVELFERPNTRCVLVLDTTVSPALVLSHQHLVWRAGMILVTLGPLSPPPSLMSASGRESMSEASDQSGVRRCRMGGSPLPSELYTTYFGERVSSIRELVKRPCSAGVLYNMGPGSATPGVTSVVVGLPLYSQLSFEAESNVTGLWNRHVPWTYLSWFRQCFGAVRGGSRWSFRHAVIYDSGSPLMWPTFRAANFYNANLVTSAAGFATWNNTEIQAQLLENFGGSGFAESQQAGTSVPALDVEIPMVAATKYYDGRIAATDQQAFTLWVEGIPFNALNMVYMFNCAADDISMFVFDGPPALSYRASGT